MDLLLWRHAQARDALPGESDMDRPLTDKGIRQAENMAGWLNRHMPSNTLILCSPAVRTVQTVQALTQAFTLCQEIRPDSSAEALLAASQWPHASTPVLVVSHQPFLSQAVSQVFDFPLAVTLPFRKGSLWWIRSRPLNGVIKPQLLTIQDADFL